MTTSRKPQMSFRVSEDWQRGRLRMDAVRTETLRQMGAAWAEPGGQDDIIAALDTLAELAVGDPTPEELEEAVDRLEDVSCETRPEVEFGLDDALRMRAELDQVIAKLARFNPQRAARRGTAGVAA